VRLSADLPAVRLVADPYPPYQWADGGTLVGLDHDLVVAAFAAAGRRAETRLLPWTACLAAMRDGSADAIFQITPTSERATWLAFSRPFRSARTLLYVPSGTPRARSAAGPHAIDRSWRLAVLEGFRYGGAIDEHPRKVERSTDVQLLAALRAEEADAAVLDAGVAEHLLDGDDDIAAMPGFVVDRPLHLAARRDVAGVIEAFEAGLDSIRGRGA
jgi:ABC-type amino acid transport substrate-binding protein